MIPVRIKRIVVMCSVMLVAMAITPVFAWDTQEDEKEGWHSIYIDRGYQSGIRRIHNEHSAISDMALKQLGVGDVFGLGGSASSYLVDLNATLFRPELKGDDGAAHIRTDSPFEMREVPAPAHFTGLPDYSYTIYDWVNKNQLCPSLPKGAEHPEECHVFLGWMGSFNANHFATQASETYNRLHGIALALAQRASKMRKKIGNDEAELKFHAPMLKEMELEALSYEGYAQHFLQDIWSTGHMWERWNGNDWDNLDYPESYIGNMAVGALAGLMHGSESVRRKASVGGYKIITPEDMLSSPAISNDKLVMPQWSDHTAKSGPYNGVGDYRLFDMIMKSHQSQGHGDNKIYKMEVSHQQQKMMLCVKASWASIIRAFGKQNNGWGMHEANLASDAPNFDVRQNKSCSDVWATNESIYNAWSKDGVVQATDYASIVLMPFLLGGEVLSNEYVHYISTFLRTNAPAITAKIRLERLRDKHNKTIISTTLARGAIGMLGKARPGMQHPGVASYTEPVEDEWEKKLPELDKQYGRDKAALYGLFARSHGDYFCGNMEEIINKYRQSSNGGDQSICRYLASMAYQGTDPAYGGQQSEKRTNTGKKYGKPVRSICALQGIAEVQDRDQMPFYLAPGYIEVGNPYAQRNEDRLAPRKSYRSIEHWCRRTPVVNLSNAPELRDKDYVKTIEISDKKLELTGFNFGEKPGQVKLALGGGGSLDLNQVVEWTDQHIVLDLTNVSLEKRDYFIDVTRGRNVESVGLFKLKVVGEEKLLTKIDPVILDDIGPCGKPVADSLPSLDVMASIPPLEDFTPASMQVLGEAAKPFWQKSKAVLDEQIACMKQRREKMKALASSSHAAGLRDYWSATNHPQIKTDVVNNLVSHYYDPNIQILEEAVIVVAAIEQRWPSAQKRYARDFPSGNRVNIWGFWPDAGTIGQNMFHEEVINLFEAQVLYLQLIAESLSTWTRLETSLRSTLVPLFISHLDQRAITHKEIDDLYKRKYGGSYEQEQAIDRLLVPYESCGDDHPASWLFREISDLGELGHLPGLSKSPWVNPMLYFYGNHTEDSAGIEDILQHPRTSTYCQFYNTTSRLKNLSKGQVRPNWPIFQFDEATCPNCDNIDPLVKRYEERIVGYQAKIKALLAGEERDHLIELVERSKKRLEHFAEMKQVCQKRCHQQFDKPVSTNTKPLVKPTDTASTLQPSPSGDIVSMPPLAIPTPSREIVPMPPMSMPTLPEQPSIPPELQSYMDALLANEDKNPPIIVKSIQENRLPPPPPRATSDGNSTCSIYPEPLRSKCFDTYQNYYNELKVLYRLFRTTDDDHEICKLDCDSARTEQVVTLTLKQLNTENIEMKRQEKLKESNDKLRQLDLQKIRLIKDKKRLENPNTVYLYENINSGALVEHAGEYFEPKPPLKFVGEKPGKPGAAAKKEIAKLKNALEDNDKERAVLLAQQKEITEAFDNSLTLSNALSSRTCSESQREAMYNHCLQNCAPGEANTSSAFECMSMP